MLKHETRDSLKKFVKEDDICASLEHPFCVELFYQECGVERYLSVVNSRVDLILKFIKKGDISSTIRFVEKAFRLTFLKYLFANYKVSDEVKKDVTVAAYLTSEYTSANSSEWLNLFKSFETVPLQDVEGFDGCNDELIVFRGCANNKNEAGCSFTTELSVAEFFASRFSNGYVLKAKLKKSDVLAYITERGEFEVIADYDSLYDVSYLP